MTTRFCPHILGAKISGHESSIVNTIAQTQPTVMLVMDSDNLATQINTYAPHTLVIQRRWRVDDNAIWNGGDPEEYCQFITNNYTADPHHVVQVLNEPAAYGADVAKLTAFLKTCGNILRAHGYRAVLGNIGSATVQPSDLESGLWDGYLRYLAAESARPDGHIAGFHEYTFALLPFGAGVFTADDLRNPVHIEPENWRNINLDDPTPYPGWWHLLRVEWFQRRAVAIGAGRFKVILTEFGWDDMPDLAPTGIRQYLTDTYGIPLNDKGQPYKGLRGILTLQNVWYRWFPLWTMSEAAYYQLEWCNRNYPQDYIGFCLFTMSYNDEWADDWGFNFDGLPGLWQRLAGLSVPIPAPEPPPDNGPPPETWPPMTEEGKSWRTLALIEAAVIAFIVIWSLISYHVPQPINLSIGVTSMEILPVSEAGNILMVAIASILAGGLAAPVTTPLVNLLKLLDVYRVKFFGGATLSGDVLSFVVAALVTIVVWVSQWLGVSVQVNNVFDLIVAILPAILAFLATVLGQRQLFQLSVKNSIPVFGYQRTK